MIIFIVSLYLLLAVQGEENGPSVLDETFQYPDVSNHKNINLLPKNCGEKNKKSDFPWIALLSVYTRYGTRFACGGSIINQNYILTAAHCVTDGDFLGDIRVGTDNAELTLKGEEDNFQDVSVEEITIHPKYDFMVNDVALVRVSPIDLSSETVQPICLPLKHPSFNYSDVDVKVTGWNAFDENMTKIMTTSLSLSQIPLASCLPKYGSQIDLAQSYLCFNGSCLAIDGAPVHVVTPLYGDQTVQEGIVSLGTPFCEESSRPNLYTRVAFFMDWILDNIKP